ncbi:hypothetical protein QE390_002514 [Siphonobacter sp. SORGH_AS 1065]|nr:hypothetical protein [Siphonobacter sp. SORGH_AS_1065]
MRVSLLLLVICLISLSESVFATVPQLKKSVKPTWILPLPKSNQQVNLRQVQYGYYIKLWETQTQVEEKTTYYQEIRAILSEEGVQNGSEVSIEVNPSYESLIFHEIKVKRGSELQDRLDLKAFKLIQEESQRDQFIYRGTYTASLTLNDIRKGDEIIISYSLKGRNPIFGDRYFNEMYFYTYSPFGQIFKSLIHSSKRDLQFKRFNNAPAAHKEIKGGQVSYSWNLDKPAVLENEKNTPSWYNNLPFWQITEYKSWEDVVNWELSILPSMGQLPAELLKKVESWKAQSSGNSVYLLELATRFIQNEIRYTGIEIGEYSHRPHVPSEVFRKRLGDCKDKSLLLVTLLRSAGIEAAIVDVDTYYGKNLNQYLPSPGVFNHVIVWAKIGEEVYWIDPTISHQKGSIKANYIPDYGKVLVIKTGEKSLQTTPVVPGGNVTVEEDYYLGSRNSKGRLFVKSTYWGRAADQMRANLAQKSMNELEKDYRDYYQNMYQGVSIEMKDSLRFDEHKTENKITVYEEYVLEKVWKLADSSERLFTTSVIADQIRNVFYEMPDKPRKNPFAWNYPNQMDYVVKVHFPEEWSLEPSHLTLNRDAYQLHYEGSYKSLGSIFTMSFKYTAKKDFIEAGKLNEYVKDRNDLVNVSGYEFTWYPELGQSDLGSRAKYYIGLLILLGIALAVRLIRLHRSRSLPIDEYRINSPEKIGGWLVLPMLSLIISPLLLIITICGIVTPEIWAAMDVLPNSGILKLTILLEQIANVFLLEWTILCLIQFFQRRNTLPHYIIILYGSNLLLCCFDVMITEFLMPATTNGKESYNDLLRAILIAAVWIPYFLRSTRVKRTFVFPYQYIPSLENVKNSLEQEGSDVNL